MEENKPDTNSERVADTNPVPEELRDVEPSEFAAKIYGMLLPQFENQVRTLSKKGLFRVLMALIKTPMEDFNGVLDKTEKNVYALADRLMQAKFVLISAVMEEQMREEAEMVNKSETSVDTTTNS